MFGRDGSVWNERLRIVPADLTLRQFGIRTAVSDGIVAAGTPYGDNTANGIVYAYDMGCLVYCPGDFDHGGDVDGSDLAVIDGEMGLFGCNSGIPCQADLDGNGIVDQSDMQTFLAKFGRTNCHYPPPQIIQNLFHRPARGTHDRRTDDTAPALSVGHRGPCILGIPEASRLRLQSPGQPRDRADQAWPLKVLLGAFRLVCSNGIVVGKTFLHFTRRHAYELDHMDLDEEVATVLQRFSNQAEQWRRWAGIQLSEKAYVDIVEGMGFGEKAMTLIHDHIEGTGPGALSAMLVAILQRCDLVYHPPCGVAESSGGNGNAVAGGG